MSRYFPATDLNIHFRVKQALTVSFILKAFKVSFRTISGNSNQGYRKIGVIDNLYSNAKIVVATVLRETISKKQLKVFMN